MYHPEIISRREFQARKAGLVFKRLPRLKSIEYAGYLQSLRLQKDGSVGPIGWLSRPLTVEEQEFINSERLLSKIDFSYYMTRYHSVERDAGVGSESGTGPGALLESQEKFLSLVGSREQVVYDEYKRYRHTEGIRILAHKCRQVVFTSTSRALTLHRMLFWPGTRAFAGALDPDGVGELYKRDKITLDNLPWWLHPGELYPDVKDSELGFPTPNHSRLMYQAESQKSGIGTGTQQVVSHLTEVSFWKAPYQIEFSFLPAIPKERMTLHIQEATSAGNEDYWQEKTEDCRKRTPGYESWTYIFVPWYFNRTKWRANAPGDWIPEEHTLNHAELIFRTSPEFNAGVAINASKDQLYWWETERAKYARMGKLGYFLANWPATPEQSFTNWSEGALPVELIEQMELECRTPRIYEVEAVVPA